MIDYLKTIISQYADSPRMVGLIELLNESLDPRADLEQFYTLVENLDSAVGYGLDRWGRIVVIPRTLTLTQEEAASVQTFFGFAEASDSEGFNQAPFYNGQGTSQPTFTTTNFVLADDAYRRLILAKAALNITDNSIPAVNRVLMNILFPGRGNAYVVDGGGAIVVTSDYFGFAEASDSSGFDQAPFGGELVTTGAEGNMTIEYVFQFVLEPFEIAMIMSGVLARGAGVSASFSYLTE